MPRQGGQGLAIELKQLKELRRRQQLGVRNSRLLDHSQFRENVLQIAREIVPIWEHLFNGKHAVVNNRLFDS